MKTCCYWCDKEITNNEIKRCSRCRLAMYCSKECQKISWKESHKFNCAIHPSLVSPTEPGELRKDEPEEGSDEWMELQVDKALSKWIALWRSCFCTWTKVALDLPNHPPERVATHCVYLIVEPRMFMDDPAKQYRVIDAKVLSMAEVYQLHPQLLETYVDSEDLNRMRFITLLQNTEGEPLRLRIFQWSDLGVPRWRSMDKSVSAKLEGNGAWAEALMYGVECMKLEEVQEKVCRT